MASDDRDVVVTYTNYYFDGRNDVGRPIPPEPGIWKPGEKRVMSYARAVQIADGVNRSRPSDKPLLVIAEIEPEKPAKESKETK